MCKLSNDADKTVNELLNKSAKEILSDEGPLANIKGFVSREGQIYMAESVEKVFNNGQILVAEAGTGTGKTFAYLIPALLNGKTTVISTASKALQDQLIKKDLPVIFKLLKLKPQFMALKGINNYLCIAKFEQLLAEYNESHSLFNDDVKALASSSADILTPAIINQVKKIITDLKKNSSLPCGECEFGEINSLFSKDVVKALTNDNLQCSRHSCKYYESCCAFSARRKAISSAKVVVINHALFFSSLLVENNFEQGAPAILLPKYKQIIFDEAHELSAIGREHLSSHLGSFNIKILNQELGSYLKKDKLKIQEPFREAYKDVQESFADMLEYLKTLDDGSGNARNLLAYKYSDYAEPFNNEDPYYSKKNEKFLDLARSMYISLRNFKNYIKSIKEQDEEYLGKLYDYIDELASTLVSCMTIDDKSDTKPAVASITVYKLGFEMRVTPLEVADIFGVYLKNCQNNDMGVVLTSATLSVDHNFIKLKTDLGIPKEDVDYIEVPAFFDYEHQAALYISDSFPEINLPNREKYLWAKVRDFVKHAPGGVFILTTSISALNRLAKVIREDKEQKRQVLCQYEHLSNTKMLNAFKEDGNAILIGSISFWAGVDVRGDALSLVIIDKLPFTSPQDPIFSARCRHFEHKSEGNKNRSFMDISIPEAVICLRQGVGRLIRHEKDCGAMVICDPRIKKRGYGNIFLNSLPPMKRMNTPQELLKFLHNLGESKHEPCCD